MQLATSVYSRTLRKAAILVGGNAKLCRYLQVPASELEKWLQDLAVPPTSVFLAAVDLVVAEAEGNDAGPGDPPTPMEGAAGGDFSAYY